MNNIRNKKKGGGNPFFSDSKYLSVDDKAMLDKVEVNHVDKYIQPLDWKTSWDVSEPKYNYLKLYFKFCIYNLK